MAGALPALAASRVPALDADVQEHSKGHVLMDDADAQELIYLMGALNAYELMLLPL